MISGETPAMQSGKPLVLLFNTAAKGRKVTAVQNFVTRARRTLFSCKSVWALQADNDFRLNKHFGGREIADPFCDSCGATETRTHFATCAAHFMQRANARDAVIDIIRRHSDRRIGDIPVWWDPELRKKYAHETEAWARVSPNGVELALRGIAPAGLSTFLKQDCGIEGDRLKSALQQIIVTVTECFRECWKARCKKFFARHPKPRPPPAAPT